MLKKQKIILISAISLSIILTGWLFVFLEEESLSGLEGFYLLTKEDPLFYSPFLDEGAFKVAVEGMGMAEERIKEVTIKNYVFRGEDPADIEGLYYIERLRTTSFFPYQFLESLILISQKTEEFLESPSKERGYELLGLYEKATDSYLQSISELINVLEEEDSLEDTLSFIDNQSNFNLILKNYHTIKENAHILQKETGQRKKCLGGTVNCLALRKKSNIDFLLNLLKESFGSFSLEEKKAELAKDALRSFFPQGTVRGPYKIKSACWQSSDDNHWMYLLDVEKGGSRFIVPKLAQQNYYFKTELLPDRYPEKDIFIERGLDFTLRMGTGIYNCFDLTFYSSLIVMDFIKEEIEMENVSWQDLTEEREYRLLLENQFGLLPPIMNKVSYDLDFFVKQLEIEENVLSLKTFYGITSLYSIFYMPYAHSVWRTDKNLQYFLPGRERLNRMYMLSDLIEMGYTPEEIRGFFIDPFELLEICSKRKN